MWKRHKGFVSAGKISFFDSFPMFRRLYILPLLYRRPWSCQIAFFDTFPDAFSRAKCAGYQQCLSYTFSCSFSDIFFDLFLDGFSRPELGNRNPFSYAVSEVFSRAVPGISNAFSDAFSMSFPSLGQRREPKMSFLMPCLMLFPTPFHMPFLIPFLILYRALLPV